MRSIRGSTPDAAATPASDPAHDALFLAYLKDEAVGSAPAATPEPKIPTTAAPQPGLPDVVLDPDSLLDAGSPFAAHRAASVAR